jgi:hypothetical protein
VTETYSAKKAAIALLRSKDSETSFGITASAYGAEVSPSAAWWDGKKETSWKVLEKEAPSTQKEAPSTQKEAPSTQKEALSTKKHAPSTKKHAAATKKATPSTKTELSPAEEEVSPPCPQACLYTH